MTRVSLQIEEARDPAEVPDAERIMEADMAAAPRQHPHALADVVAEARERDVVAIRERHRLPRLGHGQIFQFELLRSSRAVQSPGFHVATFPPGRAQAKASRRARIWVRSCWFWASLSARWSALAAAGLAAVLANNGSSLRALELDQNPLGDKGAIALGDEDDAIRSRFERHLQESLGDRHAQLEDPRGPPQRVDAPREARGGDQIAAEVERFSLDRVVDRLEVDAGELGNMETHTA